MNNLGKFGRAGVWCWIKESEDNGSKDLQIAYYIITWFIVILNTIFVVLLIWNLKKIDYSDEMINRYVNKLKLYPIIQIISLIPATVNRIICLAREGEQIFVLVIIQVIFDSLTGLIFSFVYGFNPNVRTIIFDFCTNLCGKKKNENEIENGLNESDSFDHPNRYRSDSIKIYDDHMIPTSQQSD